MDVETGVKSAVETGVESSVETGVKNEGKKRSTFVRQGWRREKKQERGKKELFFSSCVFQTGFRLGFRTLVYISFREFFRTQKSPEDDII